ncbi:MAG: hypothetical protein K8S56_07895 [Candidatus Cloacimonetes bacterium]|nr:hypothetical protein [Candidatus Cloacimonadota bacterium]
MPKRRARALIIVFICLATLFLIILKKEPLKTVEVFHKNKKPSLETLAKTNDILNQYKEKYEITYYDIEDSVNIELIRKYDLPETHFPFAVVIDGKFSAMIDSTKRDFVHFPLFMKGIGRHEGNWSLSHLETALKDNALLLEEHILPELEEEESECEGEE